MSGTRSHKITGTWIRQEYSWFVAISALFDGPFVCSDHSDSEIAHQEG